MGEGKYFIGIDSGSTTTNVAALDLDGKLCASQIIRTGMSAEKAAEKAMEMVLQQLKADRSEIACICATGYGRDFIPFSDSTRTEISCHAKGAFFLYPAARTIIDIGGQDSKVICLDEDGKVLSFIMNDKCAAGTGRFLEMMASALELYLSEMSQVGLEWKQDLTISSVCTVFAESEVVSLVAQNRDIQDIVHALNKAVASRVVSMARRAKSSGPCMMTGGVARNMGVRAEIERMLGESLYVPEMPDLVGATGAALFAMEIRKGQEG